MSDKEKGLPLLRKTPVDFLSPEEARQALKPDVALDPSEASRAPVDSSSRGHPRISPASPLGNPHTRHSRP